MIRLLSRILPTRQRKTWQLVVQYLGGFLLLALLGAIASIAQPAGFFERKSHDWFHILEWFPAKDAEHPLDKFLIIYIDDLSHQELNQPYDRIWDRNLHAALLEKFAQQNPELVFYDIVFDLPSSDPEADARFAQAIADCGNVILAASQDVYFYEDNAEPVEQLFVPAPDFRRAAAGWGIALKKHDTVDNGVRRMEKAYKDDRFPPAYWKGAGTIDPASIEVEGGFKKPRWVRYVGPPPAVPSVSFSTALIDDIDFSGKYVFIGARHSIGMSGAGRDVYRSPYGNQGLGEFPGVELQAIMVHNILNKSWLEVSGDRFHLVVILLAALLLTLLVNPFGPTGSLISGASLAAAFALGSIFYIEKEGIFFSWLVPVIVQTPAAVLFANLCNYYFLARKRNQLKRVFSSYLSPIMVQRITEAEEEPQLGGKEEVITPFFSDVVGYSKFSELLSPMELTGLMNDYLGAMTDVLQDEGGTLDKYIGDAIVAFFGAPLPMDDHAYRACRAAARMQRVQLELCRRWKDSGKWPEIVSLMQTRIGLNTGTAVVGNMGSPARFNYSMTGDTVNLAARCESGAKQFGVFTMVSESTYEAASKHGADELVFRRLNRVSVVGRDQPVNLYELIGTRDQVENRDLECRAIYEAALESHLNRDWATAEAKLRQSIPLERWTPESSGAKTNPSLILLDQVLTFRAQPPADDWDGVLHLSSK